MFSFLISFVFSSVLNLLVVSRVKPNDSSLDSDLDGVQKMHTHSVPRIGGVGIFLAALLSGLITLWRQPEIGKLFLLLLLCSLLAFLGGFVEDLTKRISPRRRLFLTMLAAVAAFFLLDARIERLDWIASVWSFKYIWFSLPFTVFAIAGIANAINIIDGLNGLASVVTICMLFSIGYVAFEVNDMFVLVSALMVAGAIGGFLIWNYPAGLIFLGDGGAYFIGFMLGQLAILLVMRNPQVSTWYAALLLIYPAFETLFSIYRRFFLRGSSPGIPDGIHLHTLIFRRLMRWAVGPLTAEELIRRNSLTSPYLWLFSLMGVIPATLLWRHTWALMFFCLLFIFCYVWLYFRIVRFNVPDWLKFKRWK